MRNEAMNTRRKSLGVSLIEALIAAVVLSVGLIAIAKLQSDLVSSSGDTKARSEAIVLLEQQMERLRNFVNREQFDDLEDFEDLCDGQVIAGTNAVFALDCTVAELTNPQDALVVTLTLTWQGPRNEDAVSLSSIVAWDDPSRMVTMSAGLSGTEPGDFIRPNRPGGAGFELVQETGGPTLNPGERYRLVREDDGAIDPDAVTFEDALANMDGILIVGANGQVWRSRGTAKLSLIEGYIYTDNTATGPNAISPDNIEIITSGDDQMPCFYDNTVSALSATSKYREFEYTCIKNEGWYGNSGLIYYGPSGGAQTINANIPRACVGDPSEAIPSPITITSRHAQLASVRTYRGYGSLGEFGGLGSNGMAGGEIFSDQNFLMTRGNASSATFCKGKMELEGANSTIFVAGTNDPEWSHPGWFVCLTGNEDDVNCTAALATSENPQTTLQGSLSGSAAAIEGVTLTSSSYVIASEEECTVNGSGFDYACPIVWQGVPFNLREDELLLTLTLVGDACPGEETGVVSVIQTDPPTGEHELSQSGDEIKAFLTGVGAGQTTVTRNITVTCQEEPPPAP
jgi:hypothetical protein